MRRDYWSNSYFAEWIRVMFGAPLKPAAATGDEWHEWHQAFKANHKITYWFLEEFLDKAQDFVYWPIDKYDDVRIYFINRFVDKTHYLPTKLKAGQYHELDNRILNGLFESLVDFVECEKANMELVCNPKENVELDPWWHKSRIFRWRHIRSRELGMKYLDWETKLNEDIPEENKEDQEVLLNGQAALARETIALYTWWKDVRPARPDAYDASGWSALCKERRERDGDCFLCEDKTDEARQKTKAALELVEKIETQYEQEDEQMIIRLIKIRRGLWT